MFDCSVAQRRFCIFDHQTLRLFSSGHLAIITSVLFASSAPVVPDGRRCNVETSFADFCGCSPHSQVITFSESGDLHGQKDLPSDV